VTWQYVFNAWAIALALGFYLGGGI
jgi:hypothetical protein